MTTHQQFEAKFEKYRYVVTRLASRITHIGICFDDAYNAGIDILTDSLTTQYHRFDPTKSSEGTWLYMRVQYGLRDFVRREMRRRSRETLECDCPAHKSDAGHWASDVDAPSTAIDQAPCEPHFNLREFFSRLSPEAVELVYLIIEAPDEIIHDLLPNSPKKVSGCIDRYAKKVWGWTASKLSKVRDEIAEALSA